MKKIVRSKLLIGIFSLILISVPSLVSAEVIDKVIETEMAVPAGVTISTRGPISPNINISGTISTNTEIGSYTLKGRHGELLLKLDRRFAVNTWDQARLKVKMTVSVELLDPSKETEFLNALQSYLSSLQASSYMKIDCRLGIDRINVKNGLFRGDDNTLTLRNGKQYKFKYISLKAEMIIPKDSNFEMNSKYVDVTLDQLNGKLTLELNDGSFNASYVKTLEALLRNSQIRIAEVGTAKVSAHRSKINIAKGKSMAIGQLALSYEYGAGLGLGATPGRLGYLQPLSNPAENKFSILNKYQLGEIDQLDFYSSLNDKVQIDEVENVKVANVTYSDLNIFRLRNTLDGRGEFGSLNIYAVDAPTFESINFISTYGTFLFMGGEIDNLEVNLDNISKPEDTHLPSLAYSEKESIQVGMTYKLAEENKTLKVYRKGQEKMVKLPALNLTCTYCEMKIN